MMAAPLVSLIVVLWISTGFAAPLFESPILFARGAPVPRPVQVFAWRVVETRCGYDAYERDRRSFWASDAQARAVDGTVVYAIRILADVTWRKTEPTAVIEMTIVDDGGLRLRALRSSFVVCAS